MWFPTLIWSNELCVLQVALAELLTVLPIFLALAAEGLISAAEIAGCSSSFAFARFLRLTRFLRIVRLGRFFRNQDSDSFMHHATMLGLYIFTIVLVAACMLQWVETLDNDVELPFHIALYYMLIEVYA